MTPDELAELIARRRSNIFIDAESHVDNAHLQALITAAQWAPNHKRTWPLRLTVVTGDSRQHLGHAVADAMEQRGDDAAKVEKTRTKYLRAPVVLVVAYARGGSDSETSENSFAVAAGIQNLLLTAEAHEYAALWGSPAKGANDAITSFCGMADTDTVVGLIYLGRPLRDAPPVERPAAWVTTRS